MDKTQEALKLALEALDRSMHTTLHNSLSIDCAKAITAIREALAEQPAQEEPSVHAISGRTADELWLETGRLRSELADLKTQQQEPLTGGDERRHIICLCPDCTKPAPATELREQQEPVAKVDYKQRDGFRWLNYLGWQRIPDGASLYTSPPVSKPKQQEPVAKSKVTGEKT